MSRNSRDGGSFQISMVPHLPIFALLKLAVRLNDREVRLDSKEPKQSCFAGDGGHILEDGDKYVNTCSKKPGVPAKQNTGKLQNRDPTMHSVSDRSCILHLFRRTYLFHRSGLLQANRRSLERP